MPSGSANGVVVASSGGNRIGGWDVAARNLISGNGNVGILFTGSFATPNVVVGNWIGTDATGNAALANSEHGIEASTGSANTIGGTDPGAGNVIAGNGIDGISISASGWVIQANLIGVGADSATKLPNGRHGVRILGSAANTLVGGAAPNHVAYNTNAGVLIALTGGNGNTISSNSIHDNGALGIDINGSGVNANDLLDVDTGSNEGQNFPVLETAFAGGATIDGTLDSTANTSFTIELFASAARDSSGHGEATELVGSIMTTTDALGHAEFTAPLSRTVGAAEFVTATATNPNGSTSELSACTPAPVVTTTTTSTTSSTSTSTSTVTTSTSTVVPTTSSTSTTIVTTSSTSTTVATTSSTSSTTAAPDPTTTSSTTPAEDTTTSTSTLSEATTSTSTTGPTTSSTSSSTLAGDTTTSTSTLPEDTTTSTTAGPTTSSTSSSTLPSATTTSTSTLPDDTTTSSTGGPTTSSTSSSTLPSATTTSTSTLPDDTPTSSTSAPTTSSTSSSTLPGDTTTSTSTLPGDTTTSITSGPTTSSTSSTTVEGATTTSTSTLPEDTTTSTTSGDPTTTTSSSSSTSTTDTEPTSTTAPSSTSTTDTTSTTLLGATTSTSTTVRPGSTTSTTLPDTGCGIEVAFTPLRCRLTGLVTTIGDTPDLNPMRAKLAKHLAKAQRLFDKAEARCQVAKRKPAKRSLRMARRRLVKVGKMLLAKPARRTVPPGVTDPIARTATTLGTDLRTLASAIACK